MDVNVRVRKIEIPKLLAKMYKNVNGTCDVYCEILETD